MKPKHTVPTWTIQFEAPRKTLKTILAFIQDLHVTPRKLALHPVVDHSDDIVLSCSVPSNADLIEDILEADNKGEAYGQT